MGVLTGQRAVLKAFARSRRRPVRRKVEPLSRVRLFLDEWLVWRLMPRSEARAGLARAIAERRVDWRGKPARALAEAARAPLPADRLFDPVAGAERFAVILEAMRQETGLSLRENQIACALRLLSGECVELRTGEGKTLAAALAALAAASVGVSVHVVTVNDYLAERDHALMAPIAAALGLTSAVVLMQAPDADKRAAYDCDIVYGTNKTFVFDHLRDLREARSDGPAARPRQTGQALAIVDEVDSVLIDDATVPMILSEPAARAPAADLALFRHLLDFAAGLAEGEGRVLDRHGNWRLTPAGIARLESVSAHWRHPLSNNAELIDLAESALMARYGLREGVAYIVRDGEIALVDQGTGRLMPDRKWSYGLQQMVEMTAGLEPSPENTTVGQITQQTYFRQYRILSGLTGTARECRGEFWAIYGLRVQPVAPHAPSRLSDMGLRVLRDADAKWRHVAARAIAEAETRAVLVGLNDVAESAALQAVFAELGREVAVLDALSEAQEADLVAVAGTRGRITIATHLAGRGTDIGLAPDVRAAGGLHVIIASVMASGRLERQLYGRAGRQGDPGSYERVISLEDRGLSEGAFSVWRSVMTWALRRGILPAVCLAQVQADRDRRARDLRRRTLLREQDMARRLGYR
jgi:preprotein translocase subunit SecA